MCFTMLANRYTHLSCDAQEDAIKAAIRDFNSKRKAGQSGSIDVTQSVVTGKTEATVNM